MSIPCYTDWSAVTSTASQRASSTRSPARFNSTTPNGPTSATSPVPHTRRLHGRADATPNEASQPKIHWTLDAITGAAAFVSNDRLDILAANQLGRALYSELYRNRPNGR